MLLYVLPSLIILSSTGNNTNENWVRTQADVSGALANGELLVQATVYPAYDNGNITAMNGLVNVTADGIGQNVPLPYKNPDGSPVYLGQPGLGYPPSLYPNLTYIGVPGDENYSVQAEGRKLNATSVMLNGPLILGEDSALLSATTGILNNTNQTEILGWLTVIVNASMLFNVRDSGEGLGKTGEVLIIGPEAEDNQFPFDIRTENDSNLLYNQEVRFVLPPVTNASLRSRHAARANPFDSDIPFYAQDYPALVAAWSDKTNNINNAGSELDTHNEEGKSVAVGYAQIRTPLVDWVLMVEQSHHETVEPINQLRDIVLICVFSVTGGLLIATFPIVHYSVRPIRALRAATRKTVEPYQPDDSQSGYSGSSVHGHNDDYDADFDQQEAKKEGFFSQISKWATNASPPKRTTRSPNARRLFRIPAKVPEKRHLIYDELTDLTSKFNEMSDELTMQYQRLEERVKERTAELEQAKKVAEAANQSKTLFIANISHELKTPLNGILGLAQICMNEDDPSKIKSTLNTIYKSGDLLLHLLTDLLTFSKNEVGQQLSIDESEFRLSDLRTQLMPTFDRQAKEAQVNLTVLFFGTNDSFGNIDKTEEEKEYGPAGTGRVKDMCLWGDKNRILQVLMNFTSNSLKFTPPQGSVTVRIKCLGLSENQTASRTASARHSSLASVNSKASSRKKVRTSDTSLTGGSDSEDGKKIPRHRFKQNVGGSDSEDGGNKKSILRNKKGTQKLNINVGGVTTQVDRIVQRQRSRSPPPINARNLDFEFEVEDTGPGIPEDQQRKIFEPFVQGDLGLSKKYGGTGLGLSICAQLASLMGGELSLDSTVGKGSKFGMRIPLRYITERSGSIDSPHPALNGVSRQDQAQPAGDSTTDGAAGFGDVPRVIGLSQPFVAKEIPQAKRTPSSDLGLMKKAETEAARSGSKVRVLVAEDNKINQEVVLRMLKLEEIYDVTIAKDGQEAFEKVQESMRNNKHYHLIFMDVQMPNVDGIQSTKMIRNMGFNAPIVALTAFAEKSNEDECMASGMDYFLAKPIRRPALKQVLKKYCTTIPEEDSDASSPGLDSSVKTKVEEADPSESSGRTCVEEQDSTTPHDYEKNGSIVKENKDTRL